MSGKPRIHATSPLNSILSSFTPKYTCGDGHEHVNNFGAMLDPMSYIGLTISLKAMMLKMVDDAKETDAPITNLTKWIKEL